MDKKTGRKRHGRGLFPPPPAKKSQMGPNAAQSPITMAAKVTVRLTATQPLPPQKDKKEQVRRMKDKLKNNLEENSTKNMLKKELAYFTLQSSLEETAEACAGAKPKAKRKNKKEGSRSAPTSPLSCQPLEKKLSLAQLAFDSLTLSSKSAIVAASSTAQKMAQEIQKQLPPLEAVYVHLQAAIQFHQSKKGKGKGKFQTLQEGLQIVRAISKRAAELVGLLGQYVDDKYWKLLEEVGKALDEITAFWGDRLDWTVETTGIAFFVEKCVKFLLDESNESYEISEKRKALVLVVLGKLKCRKIQQVVLEKSLAGVNKAFKKFEMLVNASPGKKTLALRVADIGGFYSLLQVCEFVLLNGGLEKWVEPKIWHAMRRIERRATKLPGLPHVLLLITRVVNTCKPLVRPELQSSDSSSTDSSDTSGSDSGDGDEDTTNKENQTGGTGGQRVEQGARNQPVLDACASACLCSFLHGSGSASGPKSNLLEAKWTDMLS